MLKDGSCPLILKRGGTVVDSLGDRMKGYERVPSGKLTRRTPVIVRVDGRSFHTFTRGMEKPFSPKLIYVMQQVAKELMELSGNCVLAYVQSDEISVLMNDWNTLDSQPFFDNKIQKLSSIFAAAATSSFINHWYKVTGDLEMVQFDARVFNLPKDDVANYFIWRQQDWTRNSLQMVSRANFSHKRLEGKNQSDMHEMLWSEKSINWNDFDTHLKRGTFLSKEGKVVIDKECPIITKDRNYVEQHLESAE